MDAYNPISFHLEKSPKLQFLTGGFKRLLTLGCMKIFFAIHITWVTYDFGQFSRLRTH